MGTTSTVNYQSQRKKLMDFFYRNDYKTEDEIIVSLCNQ